MKISIIGGSITGTATALHLVNAGHKVTVYEARPRPETNGGGTLGITLQNYRKLTAAGVAPDAGTLTKDITRWKVTDRAVTDCHDSFYSRWSVSWSNLNQALIKAAGPAVEMRYNQHVTKLADVPGDMVVIAAGRSTRLRAQLDPSRLFHYGRYMAFRGQSEQVLNNDTIGRRWYVPNHLQLAMETIPVNGQQINDWTAFVPFPFKYPRFTPKIDWTTAHEVKHHIANLVPDFPAEVVMTSPWVGAIPMGDVDMPTQMVFGRYLLMGDALVPMRPHTAMGANLGLREAANLPQGLQSASALAAWESDHLRVVGNWHLASERMGDKTFKAISKLLGYPAAAGPRRAQRPLVGPLRPGPVEQRVVPNG
jgi:2-polyprenyl-6-methoxyphenol hydroxylase-like FAD-dependent oxidoreductase